MLVNQTMEEGWSWDIPFHRGFNDWEMELVGGGVVFFHTLEPHKPSNGDGIG